MKRLLPFLLLGGALLFATGCDELEEISIDLGGLPGYALGGLYSDPYYDEPYYVEETVYVEESYGYEEYYVDDPWYWDGWGW